jgi:hypothetical protein
MKIYTEWDNLKIFIGDKNLQMFYSGNELRYQVYTFYNQVQFFTELWKNAEGIEGIDKVKNNISLLDFENNYKSTSILL